MSTRNAPASVRMAYWFWIVAIITALTELAARFLSDPRGPMQALSESGTELAVRTCAYVLLFSLATFMRRGSNVARHLLALIYGGLGTLSLVLEPIMWGADGGDALNFLSDAGLAMWSMIISRVLHLVAVWGGVILAYRSDASAYFRRLPATRTL
ncbi:hypothetical protein ACHMW4_07680 [Mesorhizobium sp. UC22_110]|uniref:hypothetical protein n=1 Tax=unclassified Mesorhizobium TaxID=325217 RepID=UPI003670BBAF